LINYQVFGDNILSLVKGLFSAMHDNPTNVPARKAQDLCERLIDFAVRILALVKKLPRNDAGPHVGRQLLRCATSSGANYEEARGAESPADFVHKLGVVSKELKESRYWLKIILRAQLSSPDQVASDLDECEQLCAIIGKSIITAKKPARPLDK
jgi:four helix bundle protein